MPENAGLFPRVYFRYFLLILFVFVLFSTCLTLRLESGNTENIRWHARNSLKMLFICVFVFVSHFLTVRLNFCKPFDLILLLFLTAISLAFFFLGISWPKVAWFNYLLRGSHDLSIIPRMRGRSPKFTHGRKLVPHGMSRNTVFLAFASSRFMIG